MPSTQSNSGILRLIAIFKLCKAALLIAVGVSVLKLVHNGNSDALEQWVATLALKPGAHYLDEAVSKLASIPPNRLKDVGFGSFVYAALFLTEGTGLWLRKPWAEWFTTIMTASLIPLEIYEIVHHPTVSKGVVLVINIAVVAYLILQIRKRRSETR
jgi:uncharacterized membrane protein (DUF2068 family)